MIIFTYKLDKYIKKIIFPKILLQPNNFIIKGSYRRRIPYITDIDVVSTVYPEITKSNIYLKTVEKISNLESENIILVYVSCGTDNRFRIETGSDEEINQMKNYLPNDDYQKISSIQKRYSEDLDRKIFFIGEIIWKYYKIRWTPSEIIADEKKLVGNKTVKFSEIVKENSSILFQFYVKLEGYPVGIDVVTIYEPLELSNSYKAASEYQLKLANYSREYYFMLFPFKFYFRENRDIATELEELIEKRFGLYKQLLVGIDTYDTLYQTGNLDIRTATNMVNTIIRDTTKLENFHSNIINQIKKVAQNNSPDVKMSEWHTLLNVLYDEINLDVNTRAEEYFFKYLDMLPENIKSLYYLANLRKRANKYYSSKKN